MAPVLTRSLPFLSSYLRLAENHVASLVAWNRALLKFMYIFARTTLTLANEGFCRPLESDDDAPGEANNFEGTGMGTGEGSKNVSDQIENEEQVEGLEDQPEGESPDDQNDKAGKDEMLDMEEDFGGKMQDVDERESNEASDNDDNEDKEDEDHLDEELGKVNPLDPTAVDDKFWDDKDDEQHGEDKSPPPEEQSRQNAGAKDNSAIGERQESNQPEDRDEQDDNGNDAKGDEAAVKHEPTVENEDQEDLPGEENEETPDDHLEGEETRRQELPEVDMDQQALDLPDDLDLDPHIKDQQEDEIDDELEADQTDADKGKLYGPSWHSLTLP